MECDRINCVCWSKILFRDDQIGIRSLLYKIFANTLLQCYIFFHFTEALNCKKSVAGLVPTCNHVANEWTKILCRSGYLVSTATRNAFVECPDFFTAPSCSLAFENVSSKMLVQTVKKLSLECWIALWPLSTLKNWMVSCSDKLRKGFLGKFPSIPSLLK